MWLRRGVVVVAFWMTAGLAWACGEQLGDSSSDLPPVRDGGIEPTNDARADAVGAEDAADAGPPCDLSAPFGTANKVDELNSTHVDKWARLSSDERVVVFGSSRPGVSSGSHHFYLATRPTRFEKFSAPTEILGVTDLDGAAGFDTDPALSPDGLDIVFTRKRELTTDIWRSHRETLAASFAPPTKVEEISLDDVNEAYPFFSATGIWFARQEAPSSPFADIFYALRADGGYAVPITIGGISLPALVETSPTPSPNGRVVYFGAQRRDAGNGLDIWVATRAEADPTFGVSLVSELTTDFHEEPSWLSDDGCRLYFHRDVDDSTRDDIYMAEKPAN